MTGTMLRNALKPSVICLIAALAVQATGCSRISRLASGSDTYRTTTYKGVVDRWTRQARIQHGLQVDLIVSVTFKSKAFRRAYAEEYAQAYQLRPFEKERFTADQLHVADLSHDFLMAAFVPEKKWDEFDKPQSMWKLYLVNDDNERVSPFEVRRLRKKDALIAHFFPYVTPWKSVFLVRFPCRISETGRAVIGPKTKHVTLVVTSVLGTVEMHWTVDHSGGTKAAGCSRIQKQKVSALFF
ncbi:MAG: hypothetical protein JRI36_01600 [Deltaproteobacteria bacterium]|nr:hypothetical protein [Deltaproteobacteria bacterium]